MSDTDVLTTKNDTEKEVANDLYQALVNKRPLKVTEYEKKVTDFDTAYRVQHAFTELKKEPLGGYKVSLTSEQTQRMFNSDSPFYGAETASAWLENDASLQLSDLSEVLGNPLNSLQWLVKKLSEQGVAYPKGTKVSSGTFLLPPHLEKGHYVAHFDKYFDDVRLDVE
ncbi:hypothetical protein ATX62_05080 [Oenococcus oeni]|uniref:hypothetical protein n=1 Tax=Oenococcus oeni TaxID=1247 RepID=UPI0008F825E4|nr:hypothetical protein [Oenococcus oeni]OIM24908.1 hypothetical protein ATX62_05080 [Oenococcus oeni]